MKSIMKRFLTLFLTAVLGLVLFDTTAFALIWNGSSSAGGGGGSSSNGYAVNVDGTSLVGFRFSLVDSDNEQCGESVDVFTGASMDTYSELSSAQKFDTKKSKAFWVGRYSLLGDESPLTTSTSNANCYVQSDMDFRSDLPAITGLSDINNNLLANTLDTWQQYSDNIDALLYKMNYSQVNSFEKIGNHTIIVEPILQVRLAGVRHVVTVTELALHGGGYVFNGNWDSNGGSSNNTGSWGFISEYTNRYFPMYMTTNGGACNWGTPSTLTKRATFRDIITKGYGVSVMSGEPKLTVVYHSNGADRLQYFMEPITEDDLVNKCTQVFRVSNYYQYGLWDVDDPYELYLSKDGEITTGNWLVGSSNSSKKISQTFAGTGQELAEAMGTTLEDGSKTVHVFAEWEPQPDVAQYTVRHNLEGIDGLFRVEDAEIFRAAPGTSIQVAGLVKTYEGFSYSHTRTDGVNVTAAIVRGDGSLVIDLFYTRNKYTVTLHKGTGISATTGAGTYYYGEEVVIDAFLYANYFWYQWTGTINTTTQRYTFSMPARNVTMTANTRSNNNIPFQVNHHLMNLDGSTYTLKEAETLYAYDGTTVPLTGLVNTYLGFTYKEGKVDGAVVETATVRKGVSLVIDLYYSRNKYTVTLNKGAGISSTTGAGTYFYDEEVTINATVSTGYAWGAWDGHFLTTTKKYTFKMPAEDVSMTANAVPGGEDAPPFINAVDRWFSLDEAQAGGITLDELMKTAEAVDGTVGDVTDFSVEGVFTILGYNEDNKDALADEFKRFTASGSATVTYYAEDKAGNTAYCTVTVHIVAWDQQHVPTANTFVRFIDVDYFGGIANQYVAEEDGGLHKDSIWIKNDAYRMKLIEALYNLQNESTGKWHTVYQTWTFTKEQVAEAKQYVEEHGLGKVKSDDALIGFFNKFKVR